MTERLDDRPSRRPGIAEDVVAPREHEPQVPFRVDERVLRPRVAGFISVGGSLPTRWKTLALPEMHALTFSMHIGVVDQIQFGGAGLPGSILLDESAVPRADELGRNVVGQIGRASEDVYADFAGQTALGRFIDDSDVAHAVRFLVSDGARNVTGHDIVVDAGWDV